MSFMNRLLKRISGQSGLYRTRRRPFSPFGIQAAHVEILENRRLLSALTVTSTKDSGAGSLRAEIAAAHSGDTIVFSSKLFHTGTTTTITLTSGELHLTKNLTIQGPGAGQLTISGNSSNIYTGHFYTRVFEVAPHATIALSGLTISNGSGCAAVHSIAPWDGYGGGILNHGTLTVSACTIDNSHALNEGGGIFSDGTLTVSGCTVSGNNANDGGALWNRGTATFVSSTISHNSAQDTSSGSYQPDGAGGGIFNHGTLTLSGCTVSSNYTNSAAGGIYNDTSGTVTVENSSTITGNIGVDVYNFDVLHVDSTSTISSLFGNPAILI